MLPDDRYINIIPPQSISKAGYMSEISIGTRQFAKSNIVGVKKKKKKKKSLERSIPGIPINLDLDAFGTGEAFDKGRSEELLSSPRENVDFSMKIVNDRKVTKCSTFNKTMDIKYDEGGELLLRPEADPVDKKYEKYCVRRPWSSRHRAAIRQQQQQQLTFSSDGVSSPGLSPSISPDTDISPELAEQRMLAVLEDQVACEAKETSDPKPSTFYLSKSSRYLPDYMSDTKPCIGQYNPRYTCVQRSPVKVSYFIFSVFSYHLLVW